MHSPRQDCFCPRCRPTWDNGEMLCCMQVAVLGLFLHISGSGWLLQPPDPLHQQPQMALLLPCPHGLPGAIGHLHWLCPACFCPACGRLRMAEGFLDCSMVLGGCLHTPQLGADPGMTQLTGVSGFEGPIGKLLTDSVKDSPLSFGAADWAKENLPFMQPGLCDTACSCLTNRSL